MPNYQRYLAKLPKKYQDASNQLPDLADVSIDAVDEQEPEVRHSRCVACLIAADRSVATGRPRTGWTLLSVHVSLRR